MLITNLIPSDEARVAQVAQLLAAAFAGWPGTWATFDEALMEVRETFGDRRVSLVALDEDNASQPLGWIGGRSGYGGYG